MLLFDYKFIKIFLKILIKKKIKNNQSMKLIMNVNNFKRIYYKFVRFLRIILQNY